MSKGTRAWVLIKTITSQFKLKTDENPSIDVIDNKNPILREYTLTSIRCEPLSLLHDKFHQFGAFVLKYTSTHFALCNAIFKHENLLLWIKKELVREPLANNWTWKS